MKREHKLKIVSFLIAATLWYFVVWGKPVEKVLEVPIEAKVNYGSNYVWEINPSAISLKILATRSQLRNFNKDKIQIPLDLLNYPPGIHQVRVPIEKITLPEGIKIKETSPNYISLVIRKISYKKVPVRINFTNRENPYNFKIILTPSFTTIKGFWEDIKDINEIYTEEIDIDILKGQRVLWVKLLTPSRVLEVNPERVKIKIIPR
ncbi:MAG: hypothetical protein P3W84_002295 [Thermodesulfobacteriaceae bacterium]|nr:hypothetical protein [Thermodesulfobacteriaceae bacterium]